MISASKVRMLTFLKNPSLRDGFVVFFENYLTALEESILTAAKSGSYWCHFVQELQSEYFTPKKFDSDISLILDGIVISIEEEMTAAGFHNIKVVWDFIEDLTEESKRVPNLVMFTTDIKWIEWLT